MNSLTDTYLNKRIKGESFDLNSSEIHGSKKRKVMEGSNTLSSHEEQFCNFPENVKMSIFAQIGNIKDLCNLRLVSKEFDRLAGNISLWGKFQEINDHINTTRIFCSISDVYHSNKTIEKLEILEKKFSKMTKEQREKFYEPMRYHHEFVPRFSPE